MADKLTRIAIVNSDKCKPKVILLTIPSHNDFHTPKAPQAISKTILTFFQKCRQECKRSCPVVRSGKLCIEVESDSKLAYISERLCIGYATISIFT